MTAISKVKGGYKLEDSDDVFISVTTVLGRLAKPALYFWYGKYCRHTLKGIADLIKNSAIVKLIDKVFGLEKDTARDILKRSQEVGNFLNDYTNSYLTQEYVDLDKASDEDYGNVIKNFHKFAEQHKIEDIIVDGKPLTEITVWNKELGVAGSFDRLLLIDGKPVLLDWKTSSGIWDEYWVQVQVYYALLIHCLEECLPKWEEGADILSSMSEAPSLWVVRCSKKDDFKYSKDVIKMRPDPRIFQAFVKLLGWCKFEKEFKTIKKEIKYADKGNS